MSIEDRTGRTRKEDNNKGKDARAMRKERVSFFRAQRNSISAIIRLLANDDPPIKISAAQVSRDITSLRKEWVARTLESTASWLAEDLHVLQELEKVAWASGRLDLVLKCLDRRASMLGLDKQHDSRQLNVDLTKMTNEQLSRLAAGEDLLRVLIPSEVSLDTVPSGGTE